MQLGVVVGSGSVVFQCVLLLLLCVSVVERVVSFSSTTPTLIQDGKAHSKRLISRE